MNEIHQQDVIDNHYGKMIVFVPGLGADHRLFGYQTEFFSNSIAVDWIDPDPKETLEDYAVRMATMIRSKLPAGVENGQVVVCGLSLGGMIAPYIARNLGAAGYILLCSIRHPSQFPKRYYFDWLIIRPSILFRVARVALFQYFIRLLLCVPRLTGFFVTINALEQIVCMPTRKFAELSRMMFDWAYRRRQPDEFNNKYSEMPSIQVHGNRDWLLPIKLTNPDIIIEGGGHLLSLTHPNQINEIIQNFLISSELENK
ncbi:MAG: alpha/beta hydrolase [Planctomycetaceae bacterium]|nr:alpha/beta hydrolase [Planctomycetaceae bacterium]